MARRRRPPRPGAANELPPLRILGQMAALQSIYYAAALILMLFTSLVAGTRFGLDLVFGWANLRGDTTQGWLIGFIWLCCAGVAVLAIIALIGRSKLVLDFALSLHFIHLVVVTFYTGFVPQNVAWWTTMVVSSAVMVMGGTYGCQWRELRPISFGGNAKNSNNAESSTEAAAANGNAGGGQGDEEMGFGRGRGRGRGRDGAGEYEMVNIKGTGDR
ncbi:integral membrane protein S linking to the trans Golgi network-domain-containing protein [Jackrogersella minutella]|nr:integral membrane protein S linking to the trans Golgi network-domain-containing protein [Jackrogersella minutella]